MCVCVCVCVCACHDHVVQPAWISQTLSCHLSLLSITPGRSSRLYPVLAKSFSSWSSMRRVPQEYIVYGLLLLLQQCPPCLVRLT